MAEPRGGWVEMITRRSVRGRLLPRSSYLSPSSSAAATALAHRSRQCPRLFFRQRPYLTLLYRSFLSPRSHGPSQLTQLNVSSLRIALTAPSLFPFCLLVLEPICSPRYRRHSEHLNPTFHKDFTALFGPAECPHLPPPTYSVRQPFSIRLSSDPPLPQTMEVLEEILQSTRFFAQPFRGLS